METIHLNFERELKFQKNQKCFKAKLAIKRIEYLIDKSRWVCFWSMDYLCQDGGVAYGLDPLDAFTNCLCIVEDLIRNEIKDKTDIWWQYKGDNGGILKEPLSM